ncbi:MAG: hypothetical protein ACRDRO_23185 [Pseudonocardiaceae bacterium]
MTGNLPAVLARDAGHEVLHELLLDYLIKSLILLAALLILVTAMVVTWKKFGRARSPRSGAPHPERPV